MLNVTYVTVVEEDDDDEWVTFASVAAYTGVMIAWGCAVWGSGWYHPPYWGWGGGYPYYYPRYPSYGYGASYNPWNGSYRRGAVAYGPYPAAQASALARTPARAPTRAAPRPGDRRGARPRRGVQPAHRRLRATRQGSNVYGSWGGTSVQRGDQWAQTARVTSNRTGDTTRVTRGSGGGTAITNRGPGADSGIVRTGGGDVYAGRDGNVYRNDGGSWQKYDNGSWGAAERPAGQAGTTQARDRANSDRARDPRPQHDRRWLRGWMGLRDEGPAQPRLAGRSDGAQRTRDYSSYQGSRSGRSSGSSYRPSGGSRGGSRGGGMRGGGGRRR